MYLWNPPQTIGQFKNTQFTKKHFIQEQGQSTAQLKIRVTDMRRLTTGIRSEKRVVRQFRRRALCKRVLTQT